MNKFKFWIKIRDSFWFTPTVYGAFSIISVVVFHLIDEMILTDLEHRLPEILFIEEEIAKGLYTSLVTAILTMTTISFSVIMVVLTTYSSQFSPRTLQDFMQSKVTHHVLGVFSFGFIFALGNLVLLGMHDTMVGPILMSIIAIVCLAFFIYFIHHASKWLQVSSLIQFIHVDSVKVIQNYSNKKDFGEYETWDEEEVKNITERSTHELLSKHSGYIQKIEWSMLVKWAKEKETVIVLKQEIGNYVTKGLPILSVNEKIPVEQLETIEEWIIIGNERTDLEDIEFNIQKLVEIAVKAVSPSINDPDTAIDCINRIGSILSDLGKHYKNVGFLTDQEGQLRLIKRVKTFEDYLYKSFYQIVYYGKEDVSVCYGILEILYKIALSNNEELKRKVWAFHYYIVNSIAWDSLEEYDRRHLESMYDKLKQACGK
ncbi:DUF2254 domain-containing protein [Ornithinibacillus halophilus]|uniref:Uncharacterized membrane protein n=1 Tax=Ornithinibacillus halophilus TaxID=930117 RepID=A0A1M5IL18_9BACI|nr:DUF2254 domain-containing protein [Ornithinibacillus halophilus]SHG28610.1 Uncharacterized membrane protein [Ornithinibacillus halophilus]